MKRLKCISFMKFSTSAAEAEQQLQELEGQVESLSQHEPGVAAKPGRDHLFFNYPPAIRKAHLHHHSVGIAEPGRCGAMNAHPTSTEMVGEGELPLLWRPIPKNKTWSFTQKSGRT